MGDYNAKRCTGSEDKMSSSFHFQKLFCKLSALYSCTCNGKTVVKSGADSVATSKQRTGSEKQRTGSECSAFCWFRSLLSWKTSHDCFPRSYDEHVHTGIFDKTVHRVLSGWNRNACTSWTTFLSGLPRISFLQLLFLSSIICQTCLGNIRR